MLYRHSDKFPSHTKLDGFMYLPAGWHYGAGGPISAGVVARAKDVITLLALNGFTHTDVFPNEGGEVLVTAYHRSHYIGIGVELSDYTLNYERDGSQDTYVETLDPQGLSIELSKIARRIWNMSESSTRGNLITIRVDSTTWRSSVPMMEAGCLSSNWTARELPAGI